MRSLYVVRGSSKFSGSESFYFSSSSDDELTSSVVQVMSDSYLLTATVSTVLPSTVSSDLQTPVQETSDGYLLTAMASILLSSLKISQLTNVHSYKLHAFLSLPVYFSFFNCQNDQFRSYFQMP